MRLNGLVCSQCNDSADFVTPLNGTTLLAKTRTGEVIVALHTRCEEPWADKNNCLALVPLRKILRSYNRALVSNNAVH